MKAFLILEDGTVLEGTSIGSTKEVISEIVFNTSMAGYMETLTAPAYAGQAVVMTYPLIGNYGVCYEDMQSDNVWADALIVREMAELPSNFRCQDTLQTFLEKYDVPGIAGIDTRALTRRLRNNGVMNGMITTDASFNLEEVLPRIRAYKATDLVKKVTSTTKKVFSGKGQKVAVLDLGVTKGFIESLTARGYDVTVYPAETSHDLIIPNFPDGIILSDGPGNPKEYLGIIDTVFELTQSGIPIFAVGLGHQILALTLGGDTYKMKYGHRGCNHAVKDLTTGQVYISTQDHGYAVDDTMLPDEAEPLFVNVNDNTNEGLQYKDIAAFSVQFQPGACDGPKNSNLLFERFESMMEGKKNA